VIFPWFHTPVQKLEMMHRFINADSALFRKHPNASNHLVAGPLDDDIFVKVTDLPEDPLDHAIQNWLALALQHSSNQDLTELNVRPAKSFHVLQTLTEEQLQKLESGVHELEKKKPLKSNILREMIKWQKALKEKTLSFVSKEDIGYFNENHQSIVFMENVFRNENTGRFGIEDTSDRVMKEVISLASVNQMFFERFGIEHKDLKTANVFYPFQKAKERILVDPGYQAPFNQKYSSSYAMAKTSLEEIVNRFTHFRNQAKEVYQGQYKN
jgi:hypothetical protein